MSGNRKNSTLASRIKRMMQADDDVGKISQQTPTVIAHAMELFLEQLAKGCTAVAAAREDKILSAAHLKEFVNKDPSMDFLREIVAKAPDLKEKVATQAAKRSRKDDDGNAKPAKKRAKVQQEAKESLPSKRRKGAQTAVKEEKIQGIPAHTGSKSPPYGERVEHMNLNEEEIMGKNEDEIKSEVKSKVEAKELSNLASGAKIEQEEEEQGNSPAYTHPQGGVGTGIAEVEEDDYDAE